MGNQLIIIGCIGSFNPELTTELVKILGDHGLEIRHASNRYDGKTHFAVGTGADLAAEFESSDLKVTPPTQPITLETLLTEIQEGRKENQNFFSYEKRDDKKRAVKQPVEFEKKKAGAPEHNPTITPTVEQEDMPALPTEEGNGDPGVQPETAPEQQSEGEVKA